MHEHWDALEADWQRFYGRDLGADLYGPQARGFRRIATLIHWLPPEASVWRSMGLSWSEDRELLAVNIEVLDSLRRAFLMANSKKGTKPPEPVRIPRPWQKQERPAGRGTRLRDLLSQAGLKVKVVPRGGGE